MRRGGIDDFGLFAAQGIDHGDRFSGRVVVQAENDHVYFAHQRAFGLGVFAEGRGYADDFDVGHLCQTFAYLESGGAGFAIDKDFGHVVKTRKWG